MCQIAIDRVDADTRQQATTLTIIATGQCSHGGDAYMRVLWDNGQLGPETPFIQVEPDFHQMPITYTAHNPMDRIQGVRVVLRCKVTSVYQEHDL